MTEREALKLALEKLKDNQHLVADNERHVYVMEYNSIIEKCEEVLAQPEQEPVATISVRWHEPVGKVAFVLEVDLPVGIHKVYTTPLQRTWVGLTRAERFEIEKDMSKYYDYQHQCKTVCLPEFAAAIEAKLKEKNSGNT